MARASCSNRALWRALRRFTATMRPKRVSRAFQTSPMPPAPRGATISYGPSLSPTESGIGVIYQVYLVGGAWFPYHGLHFHYRLSIFASAGFYGSVADQTSSIQLTHFRSV